VGKNWHHDGRTLFWKKKGRMKHLTTTSNRCKKNAVQQKTAIMTGKGRNQLLWGGGRGVSNQRKKFAEWGKRQILGGASRKNTSSSKGRAAIFMGARA